MNFVFLKQIPSSTDKYGYFWKNSNGKHSSNTKSVWNIINESVSSVDDSLLNISGDRENKIVSVIITSKL